MDLYDALDIVDKIAYKEAGLFNDDVKGALRLVLSAARKYETIKTALKELE